MPSPGRLQLAVSRPREERLFFRDIESDVLPGSSPEADSKIRMTISHLHERILGRYDAPDSPEVDRTYKLFAGIGWRDLTEGDLLGYHVEKPYETPSEALGIFSIPGAPTDEGGCLGAMAVCVKPVLTSVIARKLFAPVVGSLGAGFSVSEPT